MKASVKSIRSELECFLKNRVEDFLASVNKQVEKLREEVKNKIEEKTVG
jgi:hypothetical protein